MNLKVKKLGHNWYLDINHDDSEDIRFNNKISKTLSLLDKDQNGQLEFELTEAYSIIYKNAIFINESDIFKYFTTDDYLEIRFIINDHEYSISSDMYYLLESQFNFNFHNFIYTLEIHN